MGHQRGFTKPLVKKKCPFPLKELSRISHASLFPALAVVWQLLLDLLRLPSSQSHPSPPSSPLSPCVWLDREGGGGPLSLFSLSLCSLMFLIDSMWQLHGRLQSHPLSPKGRSRCLSPGSTSPHCPPQIGLLPPPPHTSSRTAHETLGTFISKQAPCSIQFLSTALPWLQRGAECLGFYWPLTSTCAGCYVCVGSQRLSVLTGEGQTLGLFTPACVEQPWRRL